jgi:hypothetical protein
MFELTSDDWMVVCIAKALPLEAAARGGPWLVVSRGPRFMMEREEGEGGE